MAQAAEAMPDRRFFRAAEVCELAGVPPYVLKSWELEFPALAGEQAAGGARVYSRGQVELIMQIKQLVFDEGLTLGAARREIDRLQETSPRLSLVDPPPAEPPEVDIPAQVVALEQALRDVLQMLESDAGDAAPASAPAAGDR